MELTEVSPGAPRCNSGLVTVVCASSAGSGRVAAGAEHMMDTFGGKHLHCTTPLPGALAPRGLTVSRAIFHKAPCEVPSAKWSHMHIHTITILLTPATNLSISFSTCCQTCR